MHPNTMHALHLAYDPQRLLPAPKWVKLQDSELQGVPAEGSNTRVVLPITLLNEKDVLPRDYIVHLRSQRCGNCGTIHEWSDTYARNELPPRHNMGKHVHNLIPITKMMYDLPVRVIRIPETSIPVCHECATSISLSHLPDPRNSALWHAVLVRKEEEAREARSTAKGTKAPKAATPKSPKRTPTLDDIL